MAVLNGANAVRVGSSTASAVYLGSTLVWSAAKVATLLTSGGWTWFTDQRAFVANGKLYVGGVDMQAGGDVVVQSIDDSTGTRSKFTLADNFEADDHDNPALYLGLDNKVTACYSKHGTTDEPHHLRTQVTAGDNSAYTVARDGPTMPSGGGITYSNIFRLSGESNRLYIMFRGRATDPRHPMMSWSDDDGVTWATPLPMYDAPAGDHRPYVRYNSNGVDRIDIWTTHGHPRDYSPCHIDHFYYKAGNYYATDGTLLCAVAAGPVHRSGGVVPTATRVHDAVVDGVPGWTWSVGLGSDGHPRATYVKFVTDDDHRYRYARWTGSAWVTNEITPGGTSLYGPAPTAEPQYSGGAMLDPVNPNVVWLCRQTNSQWELEMWVTADGGTNWTSTSITTLSSVKNFRPIVPMPQTPTSPRIVWLSGNYSTWTNYNVKVKGLVAPSSPLILPGSTVVTDNYTGTDGAALEDHTSDSGHIMASHPLVTTPTGLKIHTNRLRGRDDGLGFHGVYDEYFEGASLTVTGTMWQITDNNQAILGVSAYVNPRVLTFLTARYNTVTNLWEVFKFVAGSATSLGTFSAAVNTFSLVLTPAGLDFRIAGVSRITALVSAYADVPQAGLVGVRGNGGMTAASGLRLDSFTATRT